METCNTDIKIEVDDDDSEDNNNSEQITRLEQPLALIKRKERDITERFPYIEEVTTTTPSRYTSILSYSCLQSVVHLPVKFTNALR